MSMLPYLTFCNISASPTRRMCMSYNRKNPLAKLSSTGDTSEYLEEVDNDIEDDDDDDVQLERNNDVSYLASINHRRRK